MKFKFLKVMIFVPVIIFFSLVSCGISDGGNSENREDGGAGSSVDRDYSDGENKTQGSCPEGFERDGFGECIDIDECEKGRESLCSFQHAKCVNEEGGFRCICQSGFVLDSSTGSSCVPRLDFEGPVYRGNVILISNESTDLTGREFTGRLDGIKLSRKSRAIAKEEGESGWRLISPVVHLKSGNRKFFRPVSRSKTDWKVGDTKRFFAHGEEGDEIDAVLRSRSNKCNIWVEKSGQNSIDMELADGLAEEFDNVIYGKITGKFFEPSDIDGDDRINILFLKTMYPGIGKVAGYFDPNHLYDAEGSNKMEIIFVDYEAHQTLERLSQVIAHEFTHMVHIVHDFKVENNDHYEAWMGEGFATSGEKEYVGHANERISYYNKSVTIPKGRALFRFDFGEDMASNYVLSYLFFQYLDIQAGVENEIFKEIIKDTDNTYVAVEKAAQKHIDGEITMSEILTNFRIALLLKEPEGKYGYLGIPEFDKLKPRFYTGNGFDLGSGGAIYLETGGEFREPEKKGEHIRYVGIYTGETTED